MSTYNQGLDSCGRGGRYCSCCNWSKTNTNSKRTRRLLTRRAKRKVKKEEEEIIKEFFESDDEAIFYYELDEEELDFQEEIGNENDNNCSI